jgi:hypothetical protein
MKSSSLLSVFSFGLLALASPPAEVGLIKRQQGPGACRPNQQDFYVNNVRSNALLNLNIVGVDLRIGFPVINGRTYSGVHVNIGLGPPGSYDYTNPLNFNYNQYCTLVNYGASAVCTIPLANIPGLQCGAVDYYIVSFLLGII